VVIEPRGGAREAQHSGNVTCRANASVLSLGRQLMGFWGGKIAAKRRGEGTETDKKNYQKGQKGLRQR